MLSSYPTKHARIGNAVGLDTPASAVALPAGAARRGLRPRRRFPEDGDTLIHALIAAGGHDVEWLTEEQLRAAPRGSRWPNTSAGSPLCRTSCARAIRRALGRAAGQPLRGRGSARSCWPPAFGNVVLMIQPPRGFGENPIAIYHDPDLPPSHHYLAAYRGWRGASAPTRWSTSASTARSSGCPARDSACRRRAPRRRARRPAAGLPVHRQRPRRGDPGQAARARGDRRPPDAADGPRRHLRRAGQAGAAARRVRHRGQRSTRPRCRRSARRSGRWSRRRSCTRTSASRPSRARREFDEFVLHIDGYLCEIKDAQIRDGLHILGRPDRRGPGQPGTGHPAGASAVERPLGRPARPARRPRPDRRRNRPARPSRPLRAPCPRPSRSDGDDQLGRHSRPRGSSRHPSPPASSPPAASAEAQDRSSVLAAITTKTDEGPEAPPSRAVTRVLEFACAEVVPAAAPPPPTRSPTCCTPSTAATSRRALGLADPRPGQRAADRAQLLLRRPEGHPVAQRLPDVGLALADSLLARHLADTGGYPRSRGPDRLGHIRHAHAGRRHRRGARAARLAAGLG